MGLRDRDWVGHWSGSASDGSVEGIRKHVLDGGGLVVGRIDIGTTVGSEELDVTRPGTVGQGWGAAVLHVNRPGREWGSETGTAGVTVFSRHGVDCEHESGYHESAGRCECESRDRPDGD